LNGDGIVLFLSYVYRYILTDYCKYLHKNNFLVIVKTYYCV